jgi:hypothetical protein
MMAFVVCVCVCVYAVPRDLRVLFLVL